MQVTLKELETLQSDILRVIDGDIGEALQSVRDKLDVKLISQAEVVPLNPNSEEWNLHFQKREYVVELFESMMEVYSFLKEPQIKQTMWKLIREYIDKGMVKEILVRMEDIGRDLRSGKAKECEDMVRKERLALVVLLHSVGSFGKMGESVMRKVEEVASQIDKNDDLTSIITMVLIAGTKDLDMKLEKEFKQPEMKSCAQMLKSKKDLESSIPWLLETVKEIEVEYDVLYPTESKKSNDRVQEIIQNEMQSLAIKMITTMAPEINQLKLESEQQMHLESKTIIEMVMEFLGRIFSRGCRKFWALEDTVLFRFLQQMCLSSHRRMQQSAYNLIANLINDSESASKAFLSIQNEHMGSIPWSSFLNGIEYYVNLFKTQPTASMTEVDAKLIISLMRVMRQTVKFNINARKSLLSSSNILILLMEFLLCHVQIKVKASTFDVLSSFLELDYDCAHQIESLIYSVNMCEFLEQELNLREQVMQHYPLTITYLKLMRNLTKFQKGKMHLNYIKSLFINQRQYKNQTESLILQKLCLDIFTNLVDEVATFILDGDYLLDAILLCLSSCRERIHMNIQDTSLSALKLILRVLQVQNKYPNAKKLDYHLSLRRKSVEDVLFFVQSPSSCVFLDEISSTSLQILTALSVGPMFQQHNILSSVLSEKQILDQVKTAMLTRLNAPIPEQDPILYLERDEIKIQSVRLAILQLLNYNLSLKLEPNMAHLLLGLDSDSKLFFSILELLNTDSTVIEQQVYELLEKLNKPELIESNIDLILKNLSRQRLLRFVSSKPQRLMPCSNDFKVLESHYEVCQILKTLDSAFRILAVQIFTKKSKISLYPLLCNLAMEIMSLEYDQVPKLDYKTKLDEYGLVYDLSLVPEHELKKLEKINMDSRIMDTQLKAIKSWISLVSVSLTEDKVVLTQLIQCCVKLLMTPAREYFAKCLVVLCDYAQRQNMSLNFDFTQAILSPSSTLVCRGNLYSCLLKSKIHLDQILSVLARDASSSSVWQPLALEYLSFLFLKPNPILINEFIQNGYVMYLCSWIKTNAAVIYNIQNHHSLDMNPIILLESICSLLSRLSMNSFFCESILVSGLMNIFETNILCFNTGNADIYAQVIVSLFQVIASLCSTLLQTTDKKHDFLIKSLSLILQQNESSLLQVLSKNYLDVVEKISFVVQLCARNQSVVPNSINLKLMELFVYCVNQKHPTDQMLMIGFHAVSYIFYCCTSLDYNDYIWFRLPEKIKFVLEPNLAPYQVDSANLGCLLNYIRHLNLKNFDAALEMSCSCLYMHLDFFLSSMNFDGFEKSLSKNLELTKMNLKMDAKQVLLNLNLTNKFADFMLQKCKLLTK